MATNPIELTFQTARTVYCVRSSLLSGASLYLYNTSTKLYEPYNASNWALYVISIPEVAPGLYRANCPVDSLATPATEYFYAQYAASPDPTNDAPSIAGGNSQGVNIGTINGVISSLGTDVATDLAICNLALTHLGQKNITSFSDASENARRCNQIYNTCRDEVLSASDWAFSTIITTLIGLTDETVLGWLYVYAFPSNCLYVRKVFSDNSNHFDLPSFPDANNLLVPNTNPEKVDFKIVYQTGLDAMVIVTNFSPAYIEYTARVATGSLYSKLFIKALSYKLAAEISVILNGDGPQSDKMFQKYALAIGEAQRINGNQDGVSRRQKSNFVDVR